MINILKKEENDVENLDWNKMLNRTSQVEEIKTFLKGIDISNIHSKRGIYLYGNSGIGKTIFMKNILKEMDYNIIYYDIGDIKNKSILDEILNNNISTNSVISMFHKKPKKNIIFIDEIDAMNTGDKSGLNTLIKLIRPKKTKKQKMEKISLIPIVFIGNYYIDKKIKELIKVCHTVELKTPTNKEICTLLEYFISKTSFRNNDSSYQLYMGDMIQFIQNDFRKLTMIIDIFQNEKFKNHPIYDILKHIFCLKSYNENSKETVRNLMIDLHPIQEHIVVLNETERTIIGLLWHENVVNSLENQKIEMAIPFYLKQLENMCFSDYIDKITFQNQIWQFNEMSSLIKTFYNHKLYHDNLSQFKNVYTRENKDMEIRFTKVLTKYSTEYNNFLFIQYLCNQLSMDKKDLITYFTELKEKYEDFNEVLPLFENYEISKLNIQRIYRFLENNIKDDKATMELEEDIDDFEE